MSRANNLLNSIEDVEINEGIPALASVMAGPASSLATIVTFITTKLLPLKTLAMLGEFSVVAILIALARYFGKMVATGEVVLSFASEKDVKRFLNSSKVIAMKYPGAKIRTRGGTKVSITFTEKAFPAASSHIAAANNVRKIITTANKEVKNTIGSVKKK